MATKSTKHKLAYQKAYNAKPEMVKRREQNNKARYQAVKAGKAKKGDGKDVAHIVAMDSGGGDAPSNLKVEAASKNRGWRKNSGYKVPRDN